MLASIFISIFLLLLCIYTTLSKATTRVGELCTVRRTCFSIPENCVPDDCEFILSLHNGHTDFLVRDTDFSKYIAIYSVSSGVRAERYIVCFPGTTKCFVGSEIAPAPFKIESKIKTYLTDIDEDNGDCLYSFERNLFETGSEITYYLKRGFISGVMNSDGGEPAFYNSGPKLNGNLQNMTAGDDFRSLGDLFFTYINNTKFELFDYGNLSDTRTTPGYHHKTDINDHLFWNRTQKKPEEM